MRVLFRNIRHIRKKKQSKVGLVVQVGFVGVDIDIVTSQLRKYLLISNIPRFKLGSNDLRLGIRISQKRAQ